MNRRQFLESIVIASVFPFEMEADKGYWGFNGVRESGEIVFLRYNGKGRAVGECVVGGVIDSWEVRKSMWGGQIRYSENFSDRAEAIEHAVDFMQKT